MAKDEKKHQTVIWHGYEYEYREKTRDWYWVLIIIAFGLVVAAALFGNYLFAVLIAVASFSLLVHGAQKPSLKEFRVDEKGIKVGGKLYRHENIETFWINEKASPPELYLEIKRLAFPVITVPLNTGNIAGIKSLLKAKVEEKERAVPVSQKISDYFGF